MFIYSKEINLFIADGHIKHIHLFYADNKKFFSNQSYLAGVFQTETNSFQFVIKGNLAKFAHDYVIGKNVTVKGYYIDGIPHINDIRK